jgi:hypothetical protein
VRHGRDLPHISLWMHALFSPVFGKREPHLRANSHRSTKSQPMGARPQCCPIFGRGVPKKAIAPTTSSQNGSTPTPGIASRANPGKSSHCEPSTTNNSAAVTTSTAHPIGGAKLVKAPITSDPPAMAKASASRNTENLRGVEAVVSVDRFYGLKSKQRSGR